jgi:hypothetical protein
MEMSSKRTVGATGPFVIAASVFVHSLPLNHCSRFLPSFWSKVGDPFRAAGCDFDLGSFGLRLSDLAASSSNFSFDSETNVSDEPGLRSP